jgi:hypothetical protein
MSKPIIRLYHPPSDPHDVERWTAERRRRDGVSELEEGFTFRPAGRHGYVYFREGDRIMELLWEMAGPEDYDIILFLKGLRTWALPQEEPVASAKQQSIEAELRSWLSAKKLRAIFEEGSA